MKRVKRVKCVKRGIGYTFATCLSVVLFFGRLSFLLLANGERFGSIFS